MHESLKFLGKLLPLKADFRELISWWKFSILKHILSPLYNNVSIKLYLYDLEIKFSKLVKTLLNVGFR